MSDLKPIQLDPRNAVHIGVPRKAIQRHSDAWYGGEEWERPDHLLDVATDPDSQLIAHYGETVTTVAREMTIKQQKTLRQIIARGVRFDILPDGTLGNLAVDEEE